MTNKEKSFIGLDKIETLSLLKRIGAETFRYEQIQNWIFDNFCENWEEMKNGVRDNMPIISMPHYTHYK